MDPYFDFFLENFGPASRSFADAVVELRSGVEGVLPEAGPAGDKAALANLMVAALVGAMAISRGVVKADRALADEVLTQVRAALETIGRP